MQTIAFTGHRPDKLFGYNLKHEDYIKLQSALNQLLELENEICKIYRFITGGALGFDTIAFIECYKISKKYDIENVLAIPFYNQDIKWFKSSKELYTRMKDNATECIYVDKIRKYQIKGYKTNEYYPTKMQKRNEYMVDNCDTLIACWDGNEKGGTWNCVKYAKCLDKRIVVIDPHTFATYEY